MVGGSPENENVSLILFMASFTFFAPNSSCDVKVLVCVHLAVHLLGISIGIVSVVVLLSLKPLNAIGSIGSASSNGENSLTNIPAPIVPSAYLIPLQKK